MTIATIPELTATKTDSTQFDAIQNAICGDIVPRDPSGVAIDKTYDLGSDTYQWLSASIKVGHIPCGTIMPWYDYAGLIPMPQGWMLCNGDIVNKANYDAQHASGDWDLYVGSSPIENLYLFNMNNKFLKGTTGTTNGGSSAIVTGGNASNVVDIGHSHANVVLSSVTSAVQKLLNTGATAYTALLSNSHAHTMTLDPYVGTTACEPPNFKAKFLIKVLE